MNKEILPKKETKIPGWAKISVAVFLVLVFLVVGVGVAYSEVYAKRFYPVTTLGGVAIGGQAYQEVENLFKQKTDSFSASGVEFLYDGQKVKISPQVVSPDNLEISYDLIYFDNDVALRQAWKIGREGDFWGRWQARLATLFGGQKIDFSYRLNGDKIIEILRQNFSDKEKPGQNARLVLAKKDDVWLSSVEAEKTGQSLSYAVGLAALEEQLKTLDNSTITLQLVDDVPVIRASEVSLIVLNAVKVLDKAPLVLRFEKESWEIKKEELAALLNFVILDGAPALGLDQELFSQLLAQKVGPTVNQEMKNAKLSIVDGRVAEFVGAQDGRKIDEESLWQQINREAVNGDKKEFEIPVQVVKPEIATADVNDLGLEEIIGVGKSNFAGSPKNRRYNIRTGANQVNGLLIKPGEEFSLITALGPVEQSTGYLPELVIKGNQTIPEYGGGLCQIGTTTFRAALDSGLPITERAAHSYRVSYYEPAGLDATIYIPHPDVRFINDTGKHILIQTKIIGDELRFEFWGTRDGRQMKYIGDKESSYLYDIKPKIWGYVRPAPTKIVESLDLPVGTKKCTEKAHIGASTEFTYKIIYPSGETKEKVFSSVYRPWQEVCLIGVEKLTEPTPPIDSVTPVEPPTEVSPVETNVNQN